MKKLLFIIILFITFSSANAFEISDLQNYDGFAIKQFTVRDSLYESKSKNPEIQSVQAFKELLGKEKIKFKARYVYEGKESINLMDKATWYHFSPKSWNGRKKYSLYYTKNDVMKSARGGDILIVANKGKEELLLLIVNDKSEDKKEILDYLGIEKINSKSSKINTNDHINKGYEETEIKIKRDKKSKKLIIIGKVSKVYEGDTFILDNLFKVRMVGIDTPEKKQMCKNKKGKEFKCGEKSKEHLLKLLGKKKVSCEMNGWGAYNRHLFICKNSKGIDINRQMVVDGYAVMSTYKPFRYTEEEQEAKSKKLGLWAGEFQHPSQWRKERKKLKND